MEDIKKSQTNRKNTAYTSNELFFNVNLEKFIFYKLYNKKLLYEGYKVVPFCPRCGTPLSSHEVAQGYKDVKEDSVYVAFKLKNEKNSYILAWTTTPWTLPGNVGLAVNSGIDYVKVELEDGDKLILGKEKLDLIKGKYKVIEKRKKITKIYAYITH